MVASSYRILFVASETRPFASTGGLADVSEALPNELNWEGIHVERIMPLYRKVVEGQGKAYQLERTPHTLMIPMGGSQVPAEIWSTEYEGTRTYFVGREEYFDRTELYALPSREYSDNFERFCFFQKAVVALIDGLGAPYDLVHLNDWQTGLVPLFLKHGISGTGRKQKEKTVFTIHNLAYQGVYSPTKFYGSNLPGSLASYPEMEFFKQINCMKAGIVSADRVNTVSPSYAAEIQTDAFGCGLDGVLRHLDNPVTGIVNGVDYSSWNPETDPYIPENFSDKQLGGKEHCKKELLKEFGLTYDKQQPLFVMISRLVDQKGLDVLSSAMEHLMALPVQFVLLGSGQDTYQHMAVNWQKQWPEKFAAHIGYSVELSHRMEAAADFFFMPSKFEPCGLNQLYSLRYGTLPIVNRVGGLMDTVQDLRYEEEGTGLVMHSYSPESLIDCVRGALALFHEKSQLRKIRKRAMKKDFSWKNTAVHYRALYEDLLGY